MEQEDHRGKKKIEEADIETVYVSAYARQQDHEGERKYL